MFRTASSTSSTDRRGAGRRAAAAAAVLCVAAGLQACGFEPMHAARGPASPGILARFEIEPIPNRTGQLLRHELDRRFRPADGDARYALSVSTEEGTEFVGLRIDETATRADLTITANFTVRDKATGLARFRGTVRSVNSYDIFQSDFATVQARTNARRRVISQLADGIARRVSVWLLRESEE